MSFCEAQAAPLPRPPACGVLPPACSRRPLQKTYRGCHPEVRLSPLDCCAFLILAFSSVIRRLPAFPPPKENGILLIEPPVRKKGGGSAFPKHSSLSLCETGQGYLLLPPWHKDMFLWLLQTQKGCNGMIRSCSPQRMEGCWYLPLKGYCLQLVAIRVKSFIHIGWGRVACAL